MKTEVVWTTLPHGVEGGKLKLSVFVSHRLYGSNGTLRSGGFEDAQKWASKKFSFGVRFPGQFGDKPLPAQIVTNPEPDPGLWAAMMKDDVPVKAYKPRILATAEIQTISSAHIAAMVEASYQAALELSPTEHLPAKQWLGSHLAHFTPAHIKAMNEPVKGKRVPAPAATQIRADLDAKVKAWRKGGPAPALDASGYGLITYEAAKFHEPMAAQLLANVPKPDMDYHQALAAFASYPEFLRACALVFDIELAVPAGLAASATVEVVPTYTPKAGDTADLVMRTAYEYSSAGAFAARPNSTSDIVGGMLGVGKQSYFVHHMDLDGAMLKLGNAAAPTKALAENATTTLPSMRSAGIALNRAARIDQMRASFARTAKLHSSPSDLYLDDLVRGYRIDVFDRGQWRPLCGRTGSVSVAGRSVSLTKEGWISSSVTSAPSDTTNSTVKLPECVARWTGWSLAVGRPGKHWDEQNNLSDETSHPDDHFPLSPQFQVPKGSLPSLRFGRRYRMRARAADLTGDGLPVTASSSGTQESEEVLYSRFDPVLAPGLVPTGPMSFGESEHHIVIRKFKGKGAAKPTARIVIPPDGGEWLAEQHGKFDKPDGTMDPSAYRDIIAPHINAHPLGPIVSGPLTDMPFLVDPMVRGALVAYTAPEPPKQTPQQEFLAMAYPGSWPKIGSLTLAVAPASGMAHPKPVEKGTTLGVLLRPGEVVQATINSTTNEEHFAHLAVADWRPVLEHPVLKNAASKFVQLAHGPEAVSRLTTPSWRKPASAAAFKSSVVEGKVWLVTPKRDFTLVHATQIPEQPAALVPSPPLFHRALGGTSLHFGFIGPMLSTGNAQEQTVLRTHAWSTDEVEAWSTWTDQVDLIDEPVRKTEQQARHGTAFKVLIHPSEFEKALVEKHEIGDTKHHEITYVLKAHSRFRKYFDPKWAESEFIVESNPVTFHAPSTARPTALPIQYAIPTFAWENEPNIRNQVHSKRTGRGLRVYIDRPWFNSGNGERLAIVLPNGNVPTNSPLAKFVTVFGADPVFAGGSVPAAAAASHFVGSQAAGPYQIPDVPGASVLVASYPVQFDAARQMWYADIEIKLDSVAYMPFVKLALARYQEHSLSGLELSHVAVADFMQLLPDRFASVVWASDGKSFTASVSGIVPAAGRNQGHVVIGTLEERMGKDDDAAWRPVEVDGRELEAPIPFVNSGFATANQEARFTLPADRGSKNYRLVIREYELLPSDFKEDSEPGKEHPMAMVPPTMGRRLVYVDVLRLS